MTTSSKAPAPPARTFVAGSGAAMDAAFAALVAASERRAEADRRQAEAVAAQAEAIRAAFDAGVSMAAMVQETGLSRNRIYQIRDGHRGYAVTK